MDTLVQDVRYALRTLAKAPGFSLVAVLTLALGIGANSAIFSLLNAVLWKAVPYPEPDRLFAFVTTSPQGSLDRTSPAKFNAWRTADAFEHASAYRFSTANVAIGAEPEQVPIGQVTADFFALFGASFLRGRTFSADEDRPGGDRVAVLSHGYWQRRFAGDEGIVGAKISIGAIPFTVIGVLARGFEMSEVASPPDLWVSLQLDPLSVEHAHTIWSAARLKPGRTHATAAADLRAIADDYRRRYPQMFGPQSGFAAERYQDIVVRAVRPSLLVLMGAVALVLLIACANVASLLLVRAIGRMREMAIRSAIGAGRARLVRQLMTESVILALAGGALGLVLGAAGIRAMIVLYGASMPRVAANGAGLAGDWRVIAFAIALSVLTGVAFGLVPALKLSRDDLITTLKASGSRSGSGGFRQTKGRALLVGAQLAMALVLLVGAALLIRTFIALRNVDPGFSSDRVLTMKMSITGPAFSSTRAVAQLIENGLERLGTLPGIVSASATCCLPLEGNYGHLPFDIVGRPSEDAIGRGGWITVSHGYFDVFKIPVRRGRVFTERDRAGSPPVVVISEALARKYWPTGDPLGERLTIGRGFGPQFVEPPRQIVGVVGDVREGLGIAPQAMLYVPASQITDGLTVLLNQRSPLGWVVRTAAAPHQVREPVQDQLRLVSGGLTVSSIKSMDEVVSTSTARANFNMVLLSAFGGAALLLAAIGVYGLMSYSVQQRVVEMGIRRALGADSGQLRRLVAYQGMTVALAGIAVGLFCAVGLSRILAGFLFGVTTHDPLTFVAVPAALAVVALAGVWIPAARAARVDPKVALKGE